MTKNNLTKGFDLVNGPKDEAGAAMSQENAYTFDIFQPEPPGEWPVEFRMVFFPYCLHRQPDGSYSILNRQYKLIGPQAVRFKRMTAAMAARLSVHGNPDRSKIYLYHDGTIPTDSQEKMRAYLATLARLARLRLTVCSEGSAQ